MHTEIVFLTWYFNCKFFWQTPKFSALSHIAPTIIRSVWCLWISLIFMNQRFCDILFYSPKNVKSPYLHQLIYQILASLLKKIQSLSQKKMENIPVEILELVFLLLSSLKDIQKCFSTCSKWRKIILNIFKNKNSKKTNQSSKY